MILCFYWQEVESFKEKHKIIDVPFTYLDVPFTYPVFASAKAVGRRKPSVSQMSDLSLSGKWDGIMAANKGEALDEHLSKEMLAECGIPVVAEKTVSSAEEADAAASDLGFPVVMKGLAPGAVHKSEAGLVRLDIRSGDEAKGHFEELRAIVGEEGKILVQRQIPGESELIVGMIRDPQFGPCVMCGLGGVLAEVLGDAVFATAPLSIEEALALIGRLKTQKLLNGFRGAPPADRESLARILVRVGELGEAIPQIREIDINPLILSGGKPVAVDASVVL